MTDREILKQRMKTAATTLQQNEATKGKNEVQATEQVEKPPVDAEKHTSGVERETEAERGQLLERILSTMPAARQQARAEIAGQLGVGQRGEYESSSPLLQKKAGGGNSPDGSSLAERVRRLIP